MFRMIPGLEDAEFARMGVMHRNTFLNSPGFLDSTYQVINRPGLYFAGQITGVEGYVESAASGAAGRTEHGVSPAGERAPVLFWEDGDRRDGPVCGCAQQTLSTDELRVRADRSAGVYAGRKKDQEQAAAL